MLLTTEVLVHARNKYEKMGYIVPKKIDYTGKKSITDQSKYILISIKDLARCSDVKVIAQCDCCGSIQKMSYHSFNMSSNNGVHYLCQECAHKKGGITRKNKTEEEKKDIRERTRATNNLRYGADTPMQNEEIRNRMIENNIKKYGYTNPSQSPEIINKIIMSNNQKYGVNAATMLPETQEKIKHTLMENWGVDSPMKSPVLRERARKTNLSKRGFEYISQDPEIKEKVANTCLEHYNETSYMKTPEGRALSSRNLTKLWKDPSFRKKNHLAKSELGLVPTSIQQKHIFDLFSSENNCRLNYPISDYWGDIVFIDDAIDFEYNGGGHSLSVKFGRYSEEEFNNREIIRKSIISRAGYKVITLSSNKDILPSDSKLLELLQYARTFFTENPDRTWITFDIDNSCIYNTYHKEPNGLPFNYGPLHSLRKQQTQPGVPTPLLYA